MPKLNWIACYCAFFAALINGFFYGIEGAKNIALFIAWISIFLSFFFVFDEVAQRFSGMSRPAPAKLSLLSDSLVVLVFIWFGHWLTGFFYIVQMIIAEGFWDEVAKLAEKKAQKV